MKKILLINPRYDKLLLGKLDFLATIDQPLGLAYLASYLRKYTDADIKIIDANALQLQDKQIIEQVKQENPDIVGITSTTALINSVCSLARQIKEISNPKIIIGGVHGTFTAKDLLEKNPAVDIVVKREGEEPFKQIYLNKPYEEINGIAYRNNNEIKENLDPQPIEDINSLPFPAKDLLPLDHYKTGAIFYQGYKGKEYQSIITARGCPNKCTYCSSASFWSKFRIRSAENVLDEIGELIEKYNLKHLSIKDDTFTVSKQRIIDVCQGMLDRGYDIKWDCYTRASVIDEPTLKLMKKAGAFGLKFGVESGSQDILNSVNKNVTLDQIKRSVKLANKLDFLTFTSFMIGLPYDNKQTIRQTINFAKELNPVAALFFITTPFPGTEFTEQAKEHGWLADVSWEELNMYSSSAIRTQELSSEELKKYSKLAHREFYLRPSYIKRTAKRLLKHPFEIKRYAKLGVGYLISS